MSVCMCVCLGGGGGHKLFSPVCGGRGAGSKKMYPTSLPRTSPYLISISFNNLHKPLLIVLLCTIALCNSEILHMPITLSYNNSSVSQYLPTFTFFSGKVKKKMHGYVVSL